MFYFLQFPTKCRARALGLFDVAAAWASRGRKRAHKPTRRRPQSAIIGAIAPPPRCFAPRKIYRSIVAASAHRGGGGDGGSGGSGGKQQAAVEAIFVTSALRTTHGVRIF